MSAVPSSTAAALALVAQDMRAMDAVIEQRRASEVPLVGQVSGYIVAAGGGANSNCTRPSMAPKGTAR